MSNTDDDTAAIIGGPKLVHLRLSYDDRRHLHTIARRLRDQHAPATNTDCLRVALQTAAEAARKEGLRASLSGP